MFERIHFTAVPATDVLRARDFYVGTLGFSVERDEPYGDSRWIFLRLPGSETLLHFEQTGSLPPRDTPALVLVAKDVDAACTELQARGVDILQGPADAPWDPRTRWAMVRDSEGNRVLIQTVTE